LEHLVSQQTKVIAHRRRGLTATHGLQDLAGTPTPRLTIRGPDSWYNIISGGPAYGGLLDQADLASAACAKPAATGRYEAVIRQRLT